MEEMNREQEAHGDELYMRAAFETDELMMSYYLLLNNILNPKMGVLACPEEEVLRALQRKLGQIVDLLQRLDNAPWAYCVEDINKVYGTHLIVSTEKPARKFDLSRRMGRHLALMAELAAGSVQVKQLVSIFKCHVDNVRYLLSKRLAE